jgi:FkbH-like protein
LTDPSHAWTDAVNAGADVDGTRIASQIRSESGTLAREWLRRLSASTWSPVLAADVQGEIGQRHLPVLVEIAARLIERPSAGLVAVYRDELRRYELQLRQAESPAGSTAFGTAAPAPSATPRMPQATAAALIAAQRTAFEAVLPDPGRAAAVSALDRLNWPLLREPVKRVNMLLLGDCLMNEIRCFLVDRALQAGVAVRGYHLYFSGALSVHFDTVFARQLADQNRMDFVGFSPFTFDALPLYRELLTLAEDGRADSILANLVACAVDVVGATVCDIQSLFDAPILLHSASGAPLGADRALLTSLPPLTRRGRAAIDLLNAELERQAPNWTGVVVVDEARVAGDVGLRELSRSVVPGGPIPAALFHTSRLGYELAEIYWERIDGHCQLGHVRALAVDLDGTLWSGVMAEGPVGHFTSRQVLLRDLARHGIVLIALSKGSPESLRWDELCIDQADFAAVYRSWDAKEDGLRRAMGELNLRPEQVGVVDDSPTERAMLTAAFPGLASFDPDDPRTWRRLELVLATTRGGVTEEASHRAGRYRANQARARFVAGASGHESRMRELGLTLSFGPMTAADVPRAIELFRRTNQFNTTGFMPTRTQLVRLTQDEGGHDAFVARLNDRFGDFGLVAVVVVRRADRSIESFVMSCRAMGYGVEHVVLDRVIRWFGVPVTARLVRTMLNEPCHGLYPSAGFTEQQPGVWRLTARYSARLPGWLDVREG